jgi:hypothetical protein
MNRSWTTVGCVGLVACLAGVPALAVTPDPPAPPQVTVGDPVWSPGLKQWSWSIQVGGELGIASIHVTPVGAVGPIIPMDLPDFEYRYIEDLLGEQPPYNWQTPGATPETGNFHGDFDLRFRSPQFNGGERFTLSFDYLWPYDDPQTGQTTVYRTEFLPPASILSTSVVPEPAGAALLALGALCLVPIVRRQQARA